MRLVDDDASLISLEIYLQIGVNTCNAFVVLLGHGSTDKNAVRYIDEPGTVSHVMPLLKLV